MQIEQINFEGQQLAIIVYDNFEESGVHFFTNAGMSQQLAYMNHPKGKMIDPHVHNPIKREVQYTQEVLFIKSGMLRVDFYSNSQVYLESRVLSKGDVILLMTGGHGFEVLDNLQMFEVKQGPYAGDLDKTRFKTK